MARQVQGEGIQLGPLGQTAFPEQEGDLLEGHLLREVGDDVALVYEPAVLAVDHGDRGLRGDDAVEAQDARHAQLLARWSDFIPGSGPVHLQWSLYRGRSSREL